MRDSPAEFIDGSTGEVGPVTPPEWRMEEYCQAWLKCQQEMPLTICRDQENAFLKKGDGKNAKYVSLASIITTVRPILNRHNFFLRQGHEQSFFSDGKTGKAVIFTEIWHVPTTVSHRSTIDIPMPKLDPQAAGSAMTYGKRYTLLAALGIADSDDDDGQMAMPNNVDDEYRPSAVLVSLKESLSKIDAATDLIDWPNGKPIKAKIDKLSDQDKTVLRAYWNERKEKLVSLAQAAGE